jgi:hypothetical protein
VVIGLFGHLRQIPEESPVDVHASGEECHGEFVSERISPIRKHQYSSRIAELAEVARHFRPRNPLSSPYQPRLVHRSACRTPQSPLSHAIRDFENCKS